MDIDIQISESLLDVSAALASVSAARSGGIDIFVGTVRDATKGKTVLQLEFEAYERMALLEMRKIAEQMFERWPAHAVAMYHRTGILLPGEIAVIIAVSAAHRDAAFQACRFGIDTLKETVPIWKKEVFTDGEIWVSAHP